METPFKHTYLLGIKKEIYVGRNPNLFQERKKKRDRIEGTQVSSSRSINTPSNKSRVSGHANERSRATSSPMHASKSPRGRGEAIIHRSSWNVVDFTEPVVRFNFDPIPIVGARILFDRRVKCSGFVRAFLAVGRGLLRVSETSSKPAKHYDPEYASVPR